MAISVRDTGIGLAPEHLSHIFELFSQVARPSSGRRAGWALGWRSGAGLTQLHNGTIEAHSSGPGMGSEFIVRLPVLDIRPPGPPAGA